MQPDWMIRVKEDYFKSNFNMRSRELPEMLEEMDAHGVRRAVLLTNSSKRSKLAQAFVEAHPERFSLGLGGHNLLKPMPTLKALESLVASNPVAYITVGPSFWGDTAIRLMIKYGNLRLMTSAWAPKRLPESLLHFMRTRGQDRIIFASDSPVLSITRTVTEASALELPPEVLDNYLYGNAESFFFSRPGATG